MQGSSAGATRGDDAGVIKRGIDLLRRPELNRSIVFTETCPTCGGPLTQGECLRCLISLGFLSDSQQPEKSQTGRRLTPGQLKYDHLDRKSTRLNSSHSQISYAVFCLINNINNIMST